MDKMSNNKSNNESNNSNNSDMDGGKYRMAIVSTILGLFALRTVLPLLSGVVDILLVVPVGFISVYKRYKTGSMVYERVDNDDEILAGTIRALEIQLYLLLLVAPIIVLYFIYIAYL